MTPDSLGEKIATQLTASVASHIAERRRYLKASAAVDAEQAATTWQRTEERKSREDDARRNLENVTAAHTQGHATDRDRAEARLALKRERELSAKWSGEAGEIQDRAANSQAPVDTTDRHLIGQNWQTIRKPLARFQDDDARSDPADLGPNIEILRPELPEGDRQAIVNERCAEIVRLYRELAELPHIPPRRKSENARIRREVAELGASGAPRVFFEDVLEPNRKTGEMDVVGQRGKIGWPREDIKAAPAITGGGYNPRPVSASALLCWAAPDKVIAALESSLDAAYEGIEDGLDPHEKQRRRREIKGAILEAERIECEARWQLIEQGDESVRFRPDCDPRAILGIA